MTQDCSFNYELITYKFQGQNMLCIKIVFWFWQSEQFMYKTCSKLGIFMYWTRNSINDLLLYCGLFYTRISASEKDLPVPPSDLFLILQCWKVGCVVPSTQLSKALMFQIWRIANNYLNINHLMCFIDFRQIADIWAKQMTWSCHRWVICPNISFTSWNKPE